VSSPVSIAVGALAVADFNGDGKLDLATVANQSYSVAILLGNGDGTFQERQLRLGDYFAYSVSVGDFNGDGKADLAIQDEECDGEYCSASTDIYLGNGNGTFRASQSTYAGYDPAVAGDFNGDGKQDLAGGGAGEVWITLGNGDGTFQPYTGYPANIASLATGDFNGDGKLDLVGSGPDTAAILLGNGDGTFQTQIQFIVGACPSAVVVADFNGDGKPDIATANSCSNNITILSNTTK
jgi:hypothetical protein